MLRIVAVGHRIDAPDVENISFYDSRSLLDADILIIDPSEAGAFVNHAERWPDGTLRIQSTSGSDSIMAQFRRRSYEIETLLKAGKLIVAFMRPRDGALCEERGRKEYQMVTNYDWLPQRVTFIKERLVVGKGSPNILINPNHPFAPYFKAFGQLLSYEAYLSEGTEYSTFLINNAGKPTGYFYPVLAGHIVMVPPPPPDADGRKLSGVIVSCAKPVLTNDARTPEPEWAQGFTVPGEVNLVVQIESIQKSIDEVKDRLQNVQTERQSLVDFRALLYEQGTPLENAVLRSFRLMGFEASRLKEDDLEHDVILVGPEGVAVGEIEGKDTDAIHIEKLDQLTRVVDEYFSKNDIYPQGLLIGNPYRLVHPDVRNEPFTSKVNIAAARKGFGLLTTSELFRAVVRMLEKPDDDRLKAEFRQTLLGTRGGSITFLACG